MQASCPFWMSRIGGLGTASRRVRTQSPFAPPLVRMREVWLAVCLAALMVKAEQKLLVVKILIKCESALQALRNYQHYSY